MLDIIFDTLIDLLKIIPFLFVAFSVLLVVVALDEIISLFIL